MIKVSQIHIYPVKSLAGYSPEEAWLASAGFVHDRQWMIVSPEGRMMTQREHPQMALISASISDDNLVLSSFGMENFSLAVDLESEHQVSTEVFGDRLRGARVSDDADEWLSQALGVECMLVGFPSGQTRPCDPAVSSDGDHTLFADAFPLLILSQASQDQLNEKLQNPVGINRFRPNIVLSGCNPHDEDSWQNISISAVPLRIVDHCARCSVPTVDPDAGVLSGPEPIATLASYRSREGEIYFGVNAAPDQEGRISIGDDVTVLSAEQSP
ncbi:MAG: MOSC N-terminal beta barrel domain-containing protein [Pseudomonadota bacterium]